MVSARFIVRLFFAGAAAGSIVACDRAPTERPDTMVNLATVQSGPQLQAQELEGAIARQPQNAALYARRASFRLAANQLNTALEDINRAIDLDDEEGEFYFTKARILRGLNRLTATLEAAEVAAQHGFSSPELNLLVGEANLALRHYEAALDQLDRTLRQEPNHAAALFYKGLAYAALMDTVQALDYLRASLAREPKQPEILHQLAFLNNAYHQPVQAQIYSARGLRLAPTYAPLWYDYGRQFELQSLPDSAQRCYSRAVQLDTTLYRADYRIALTAYRQHRYAVVVPHLRRALRRAPRLAGARQMLAESYESLGQQAEALAQYRVLVAENPGNRHWTYKVWKVRDKVRRQQNDSLSASPPPPDAPADEPTPAEE